MVRKRRFTLRILQDAVSPIRATAAKLYSAELDRSFRTKRGPPCNKRMDLRLNVARRGDSSWHARVMNDKPFGMACRILPSSTQASKKNSKSCI